jgi:hypothetical protein
VDIGSSPCNRGIGAKRPMLQPFMENQILQELKAVNSLGVNDALLVFRRSFDNLFHSLLNLPLEQIDLWVKSLDNRAIEQHWTRQRQMKHPHLFVYGMLWHYQLETLKERTYQRESSENALMLISINDFEKHKFIVAQITRYVLSLPFYEGVAFMGKLMGAWMLTCPEVIIRSENNIEHIGKQQVGKETVNWEVPLPWIRQICPDDLTEMARDKEMQLLFVLDYLLHLAFDDYDVENTFR